MALSLSLFYIQYTYDATTGVFINIPDDTSFSHDAYTLECNLYILEIALKKVARPSTPNQSFPVSLSLSQTNKIRPSLFSLVKIEFFSFPTLVFFSATPWRIPSRCAPGTGDSSGDLQLFLVLFGGWGAVLNLDLVLVFFKTGAGVHCERSEHRHTHLEIIQDTAEAAAVPSPPPRELYWSTAAISLSLSPPCSLSHSLAPPPERERAEFDDGWMRSSLSLWCI